MKFTWEKCADQDNICEIGKNKIVRYGLNNRNWTYKIFNNTSMVVCNNENFGNNVPGDSKICQTLKIENDASKKFNIKYLPSYSFCNGDFNNKPQIKLKEEQYEFTGNAINDDNNCSKYNKDFRFILQSKDGVHILSNEPLNN